MERFLHLSLSLADPRWLALMLLVPLWWWIAHHWPSPLSRGRRGLALALRIIALTALTLAMAGLTLIRSHDDLAVLFLVDGSDSVSPQARSAGLDFAREASRFLRPNDRAGMVAFGRDALVEAAPRHDLEVPKSLQSRVDPTASDLAQALRVASGVFPSDAKKRVVLLTDGLQNRGDLEQEAVAAAADGVEVDYLPLSRRQGPEVLLERLQAPARAAEDQAFDVEVVIRPFDDTKGTLRLFRDGTLVDQRELLLQAGHPAVVAFPQKLHQGGFYAWQAQLEPERDTIPQNNVATGFTRVSGQPRVLIATEAKTHGRALQAALAAGGFLVEVGGPERLPDSVAELAGFDAVILENLPATDLSRAQMEVLKSYARDSGGGLIAVGGDQAYGVGGWANTPLEEAMPVTMTLKETEQHPAVCLEIVIDKSGSMEETDPSGVSKMQMAKEAAIAAVDLLSDRDYVGVIAFDEAAQEVVPVQRLKNKPAVEEAIGGIGGGGGTDFFPALEQGRKDAVSSGAAVKHVLLASDGQSAPGDMTGMLARMRGDKVTLSTIAIGSDADQHTMKMMADTGGGHYYFSPDAESLPRIFTRETIMVARNYLIEEPFLPVLKAGGGPLRGFESTALPTLHGYVGTTRKDSATLWMASPKGDPLLASWRIGLGKTVAWTSDAEPRWSKEWVGWEGYPKFWTQLVRFSLGAKESGGLSATASVDEQGVLRIEAEATDTGGEFANFRDVRAEVATPDHKDLEVPLRQTGPGRYTGVTRAEQVGAYLVTVAMSGASGEPAARAMAGASVSYSPEYRISAGDGGLLARVAARTGGILLGSPAMAFRPPEVPARVPSEVTGPLLWLAALLFLLDVAVRRVIIGQESFRRAWGWASGLLRPAPIPQTTHLAGLAVAKRQAAPPPPAAAPAPSAWQPPPGRPVVTPSAPPRVNPDAPPAPSASAPPASAGPGNLAGSLLDRVKKKKP